MRPTQVTMAVVCLWAGLALGFVKTLMDMQYVWAQASPSFTNFVLLSTLAFSALLIYMISQGRNWARITYLVFAVAGSLPYLPLLAAEFERSPVLGGFSIIQLGLQAVALYLIFTAPGKSWFKRAVVAA